MYEAIRPLTDSLKTARTRKSLTQREISEKAGISQGRLSRIERAAVDLRTSSLLELARALDLELMLVPRQLVPTVTSIVRQLSGPYAVQPQRPRYQLDAEDDDA